MTFKDAVIKHTINTPLFKLLQSTYHATTDHKYLDVHPKIEANNCNLEAKKVVLILAGYKPFLWKVVFDRIKKFTPPKIAICIVSSGLYSEELSNIAKHYGWAYIHTKKNNVSYALNTGISVFKKATYIFKIDEDIFTTANYANRLLDAYKNIRDHGDYEPSIVAPMIPINGFSHLLILRRFGLEDYYAKHFERPIFAAGTDRQIENSPKVAEFFWGGDENLKIPRLDEMDRIVKEDAFDYIAAPVRFSIGIILFKRKLWQDMGMLKLGEGAGMGFDETQLCEYAVSTSRPIVISKNIICGHLSFGRQNETMKEYYEKHPEAFSLPEQ